jgi:DNA-binding Lrp family transcriptional regulator
MSFEAMAMVVKVENISPVNKLILLLLANYADDKRQCFPSYEKIAKLANCSRRTAVRSINTLSELGLISIYKRKLSNNDNQSNIYTVNEIKTAPHKDIVPSVKLTPPPSDTMSPPSAKHDTYPSDTMSPPSDTMSPNTITLNNHKDTITKYKGIDVSKFDENQLVFVKQLIDYRKDINSPFKTTRGLSGMINDINSVMTEYNMSFKQVTDVLMGNEWKTIKKDYSFDKPQSKKGTFNNVSDGAKVGIIWHAFERAGYQPNEVWTSDGNNIQQWAMDAYGTGKIQNKQLEMAQ